MTRKLIGGGFAVLMGMTLAAPVDAQTSARFASVETNVARAAELEAQATAMYHSPRDYKRAAKLHEEAAELRPAGDRIRVDDLRQAARLYHYTGSTLKARELMVQAAEDAHAAGDVVAAAESYLDAAFLYFEAGMPNEVTKLVEKAELLSKSPLISSSDRKMILSRIQVSA
jgi:ATP/maltotriose-dependent transcriptional regulator MalT